MSSRPHCAIVAATSALLQAAGWRIEHRPEALVAAPGHDSLDGALAARYRLEAVRVQGLAATPGGWNGGRVAWWDRVAETASGLAVLALWMLTLAAIVTSSAVMSGDWLSTIGLGMVTVAAAATARRSLAAGRLLPGDHLVATVQLAPLRSR